MKHIFQKARSHKLLNNKYLNFTLKAIIVIGVVYSLYSRISKEENLDNMLDHILTFLNFPNLFYLIFALVLVPVMWWSESYRWLILVKKIVHPRSATLRQSFKAMISGHALGMFIPYRIGKIGGRLLVYESKKKVELVVVNYFDGESIKLLFDIYGLGGSAYVLYAFLDFSLVWVVILTVLVAILLLFRIYLFYNIGILLRWIKRFNIKASWLQRAEVLKRYSRAELRLIMQTTGFRVLLNFLQYYLLMCFFHIDVPFFEALLLISAIYFLIGNLPLPAIAGLFARIHVALFIWSQYTDNVISISSIPLILWIFNSLLPALVGAYVLVNTNLAKNINYDNQHI